MSLLSLKFSLIFLSCFRYCLVLTWQTKDFSITVKNETHLACGSSCNYISPSRSFSRKQSDKRICCNPHIFHCSNFPSIYNRRMDRAKKLSKKLKHVDSDLGRKNNWGRGSYFNKRLETKGFKI